METVYWVTLHALLFQGELVFDALLFSGEGTDGLLFWRELVHYCTVLRRRKPMSYCFEEKWELIVHYCSQDKETVGLLSWKELVCYCSQISGEGNCWSTVLKRIDTLLFFGEENCWSTVWKRTSVLLFSGERTRWSTVLKRTDSTLLNSGEGNRWSTVLKRSENW